MKHDWKKSEKQFYLPKTKPELVKVPTFKFFTISGHGDPNEKTFQEYIGVLYSLSYQKTILLPVTTLNIQFTHWRVSGI